MWFKRELLRNAIRVLASKANRGLLKQVYFRTARAVRFISSHKTEILYLEALSPQEVRSQLEAMGLNQDWTFTDFGEAMTIPSSRFSQRKDQNLSLLGSRSKVFLVPYRYKIKKL